MTPQFVKDLQASHTLESNIAIALTRYGQAWLNGAEDYDTLKGFDIGFHSFKSGLQTTFEVKHDLASVYSGNYAVESRTIAHTRADYFLLARPEIHVFTTPQIQEIYKKYPKKLIGDFQEPAALVPARDIWSQGTPFYKFIKTL